MDGVSIAASLVGLGTAGCQIAIKLYTLASQISTASQRITAVSNDISLTAGVLKELGEFIAKDTGHEGTAIFSQNGLETTKSSAAVCENIFNEIEGAAKEASEQLRTREKTRDRIVGKIKLSRSEKVKWPFLQPSIESLRIDLREAKGTLILMLQVMNLAVSQKMGIVHQTTSKSIIEQKEIYRAILAIQKQLRGNSISGAKRPSTSGDGSGNGTSRAVSPPSLASHTQSPKISSIGKESTSVSRSTTSPSAALGSSPQGIVDVPGKYPPGPSVANPNEDTCKSPSLGSAACITDLQANGLDPDSKQSFPCDNNMPQLDTTVTGDGKQHQILDYFLLAPRILDDKRRPGSILLKYRLTFIPMPQIDIQKEVFSDKEHRQPILDGWLELRDHERLLINYLVNELRTHVSVMRLKRTYTDITFRGILFKDIPQLHFIMDQRAKKDQNRGKDAARARWEAGTRYHRPTRLSDVSTEDELPNIKRERVMLRRAERFRSSTRISNSPRRYRDFSVSLSPPSPPASRRRRSHMHQRGRTSPSPDLDTELQRSMEKPEELKKIEELKQLKKLEELKKSEESKKSEAVRRPAQIIINNANSRSRRSGDNDDSSIGSDESMNDEEAEKAVKELLGKYTTLGSVAGGIE
ncbi:MAG: hypothetical protein Q9176_003809 [Flavoplaca citrina]